MDSPLSLAIAALQQSINWYTSRRRHWNYPPHPDLEAAVQTDLQTIHRALNKLEQKCFTIAAFGLVSRGKSTVLNALLGENRLTTGPLHGVTQWPQTIRWVNHGDFCIDLIDTPGLDEIAGGTRAEMAQTVARQADLILFVVAGDLTQTEFSALQDLYDYGKPLLLVFNKIDLYPPPDQAQILAHLATLLPPGATRPLLNPEDIVLVAADPPPQRVRIEYPDRRTEDRWESSPPCLDPLRERLLTILQGDGHRLMAFNALRTAERAEQAIAAKTQEIRQGDAQTLINRTLGLKTLAIAVNPLGWLDVAGSVVADLVLIRNLARLYGLPLTSHEAGFLGKKLLIGTGGLVLAEGISSVLLGMDPLSSLWDGAAAIGAYGSGMLIQAAIAGYSAYRVGQGAQHYLRQGATWGPQGLSTAIATLIATAPPQSLLTRYKS